METFMEIKVVMMNGTFHILRLSSQATVGSLKALIQEKLRVPVQNQKLIFVNGQRTPLSNDSALLSSYGLQSGSQVNLLVVQPQTIQVFLRNEKGQTSTYDIKPDETVDDFKRKVECREGVPANQQRLVYQSKEMTTGKLSDYGVKDLSTIDLLLRLRGGFM